MSSVQYRQAAPGHCRHGSHVKCISDSGHHVLFTGTDVDGLIGCLHDGSVFRRRQSDIYHSLDHVADTLKLGEHIFDRFHYAWHGAFGAGSNPRKVSIFVSKRVGGWHLQCLQFGCDEEDDPIREIRGQGV